MQSTSNIDHIHISVHDGHVLRTITQIRRNGLAFLALKRFRNDEERLFRQGSMQSSKTDTVQSRASYHAICSVVTVPNAEQQGCIVCSVADVLQIVGSMHASKRPRAARRGHQLLLPAILDDLEMTDQPVVEHDCCVSSCTSPSEHELLL